MQVGKLNVEQSERNPLRSVREMNVRTELITMF
jgi:hypothetical protein